MGYRCPGPDGNRIGPLGPPADTSVLEGGQGTRKHNQSDLRTRFQNCRLALPPEHPQGETGEVDRCGERRPPQGQPKLRPDLSVEQGGPEPWAFDMQPRRPAGTTGEKVGSNRGAMPAPEMRSEEVSSFPRRLRSLDTWESHQELTWGRIGHWGQPGRTQLRGPGEGKGTGNGQRVLISPLLKNLSSSL